MMTSRIIKQAINPIQKIRNFGLIAHIDAGKTTTTERILFFTGKTHKIGEVHDGGSHMDRLQDEQERGITIQSAATNAEWAGAKLNIIDTPGHADFTAEVERSLRVLDGAVCVFCSVGGVEPQSETVWRQATKYQVPRICFVNKMDRRGSNLADAISNMREKLGANAVAIQIPIGSESSFRGVVDLVSMKAYHYLDKISSLGANCQVEEIPIPEDMLVESRLAQEVMIDALTEYDDELAESFLADQEITTEKLKEVIRKATLSLQFNPVMCGSALKDKGVQMLLDAVIEYLPSPLDLGETKGIHPKTSEVVSRQVADDVPFSALAFKSTVDEIGTLTFLRIYSGTLSQGDALINARTGDKERVGRLYLMHSDEREPIETATAGNIVAVVGTKNVRTGDTLCAKKDPIAYETIFFADPVISLAIEIESARDNDKLAKTLSKLNHEDPTFRRYTDDKTGEVVISGMGELHLEILVTRIRRDFKIPITTGAPMVQYKQTLEGSCDVEGRYLKKTGGKGQHGIVNVRFSHDDKAKPLIFINEIKGGVIKKEYVPAVEKGILHQVQVGGRAKIEYTGIKAVLYDGNQHEVDSSEMSFNIAGRLAFEKAEEKMRRVLLEPIMKFEVITPEGYVGDITGDLNRRRAQIEGMDMDGPSRSIKGRIPMSEMFGYQTNLMSLTSGRGFFSLEPASYAKVPISIAEKVYLDLRK
jgi:elongation factor G